MKGTANEGRQRSSSPEKMVSQMEAAKITRIRSRYDWLGYPTCKMSERVS